MFIGTQFSNLYTLVDTSARGRVVRQDNDNLQFETNFAARPGEGSGGRMESEMRGHCLTRQSRVVSLETIARVRRVRSVYF